MYYLIIAVQLYCAYHAYRTKNHWYWYLLIILVPVLGSLIYLITQVFTKRDVDKVQKELTAVINPTKKVKDLEKKVRFSDTFQNRIDLADSYLEINDIENAIENYNEAMTSGHQDDFYGNTQLIEALFKSKKYTDVIAAAEKINDNPDFDKSRSNFLYGLSLSKLGSAEKAESALRKIDRRYSNYEERYILVKFFREHGKLDDASIILGALVEEGNNLTKPNQRKYRKIFQDINQLHKEIGE